MILQENTSLLLGTCKNFNTVLFKLGSCTYSVRLKKGNTTLLWVLKVTDTPKESGLFVGTYRRDSKSLSLSPKPENLATTVEFLALLKTVPLEIVTSQERCYLCDSKKREVVLKGACQTCIDRVLSKASEQYDRTVKHWV